MATADRIAPARWPRRSLVLGLLAVSLVLNLFFVGGAVWIRVDRPAAPPGIGQRLGGIPAQLDLTPSQRAVYQQYVAAMRAHRKKMRAEIAPLMASAWDEIARPQADVSRIMQEYDAASEKWRGFQHALTTQTLDFLAALSPAQRTKFVAIIRQRHAAWLHKRSKED